MGPFVVVALSAALLLLASSVISAQDDLDDLFKCVFDSDQSKCVSPTSTEGPQKSCAQGQRCVQKFVCSNNSTVGSSVIESSDGNPCVDDLLQCCYEQDVLPEPVCGVRNPDGILFRTHEPESDYESEYGEFPWMIGVLEKAQDMNRMVYFYHCGGSLIHPQVVLTAAQCVHDKSFAQLKIRAGEWNTMTHEEIYDHQDRNVSEVVLHPEFNKEGLQNDIALLLLDSPVTLHEAIQTVCLPPPESSFDSQRCLLSGWGKNTKGGKYHDILKKIELPTVSANQCQAALGNQFELHNSSICAGGELGRQGACKGDEGSPLVCPIQGSEQHYYQAGIVSWSIECGEKGLPGIHTGVAHYRSWIDQEMQKHQLDISSYTD